MAKRSQPALYELIRDRSNPAGPAVSASAGRGRTGPPRPISIAPATALVLGATVLAIVLGAYLYGFSRGERVARSRFGQQTSDEVDRLASEESPTAVLPEAVDPVPLGSGNPGAAPVSGSGIPASPTGDPRIDGFNYLVIAQVPAESADRMVAFCRERGLDAHSVPDDTGGLRFVIVTPGFAAGERRSEPVLRLEARIRSVGLQWKSAARGNRDFSDFYPRKFAAKDG
jgi:hypothetical protein